MTASPHEFGAHDVDRALAFVEGQLSPAAAQAFLAECALADRARLQAMAADCKALRAAPAPLAPDELHESIMAAAERAELFAAQPRGGVYRPDFAAAAPAARQGARPWAVRWQSSVAAAAAVGLAATVAWVYWPARTAPRATPAPIPRDVAPVAYAAPANLLAHAPYAVVMEFEDPADAEARLQSAMHRADGSNLSCVCSGMCSQVVEGPPVTVDENGAPALHPALAEIPTHCLAIPAAELSRVLGTLAEEGASRIDARQDGRHAAAAAQWQLPSAGTVELPVFVVPPSR